MAEMETRGDSRAAFQEERHAIWGAFNASTYRGGARQAVEDAIDALIAAVTASQAQGGRPLSSYRPQHDEDCRSRYCAVKHLSPFACQLSKGAWEHTQEREGWGGSYHKFVAAECSCGLDALLTLSSVAPSQLQLDTEPLPYRDLNEAISAISVRIGLHVDLEVIDVVDGYEARLCDDSGATIARGDGKTVQSALIVLASQASQS